MISISDFSKTLNDDEMKAVKNGNPTKTWNGVEWQFGKTLPDSCIYIGEINVFLPDSLKGKFFFSRRAIHVRNQRYLPKFICNTPKTVFTMYGHAGCNFNSELFIKIHHSASHVYEYRFFEMPDTSILRAIGFPEYIINNFEVLSKLENVKYSEKWWLYNGDVSVPLEVERNKSNLTEYKDFVKKYDFINFNHLDAFIKRHCKVSYDITNTKYIEPFELTEHPKFDEFLQQSPEFFRFVLKIITDSSVSAKIIGSQF